MARKRKTATVTIRMNRDGTYTFRSRNYDLRKLFPAHANPEDEAAVEPAPAAAQSVSGIPKTWGEWEREQQRPDGDR